MKNKKPEIRFKGFSEEWEEKELGDISEVTKLAGFEFTKYIIYSEEGKIIALRGLNVKKGEIVLDEVKYIDKSDFSKLSRSKLFVGDVLLTYVGTVGELAIIPENDKYYLAPNVARIRFKNEYVPLFTIQLMGSEQFFNKTIFPLIATSSQPALSMLNVRKFILKLPSPSEQTQIGNFFKNLDSLITLHQQKYDKLLNVKKTMLEKMFPKNGADVPEIRFKSFSEAWEERKLGDVAEFNPKSDLPESFLYVDLESVVGTEMIAHREESKDSAPSRAQRLARKGDLFYQTVRPYQKNNYLFDKSSNNYVFSTGYAQMRPHGDGYFLLCLVQNNRFVKLILDRCTGTSYPAINSNDLADTKIFIPISKEEQEKIGNYFKNLDKLLTLHQGELDKLKNLKKAMLEKMFV